MIEIDNFHDQADVEVKKHIIVEEMRQFYRTVLEGKRPNGFSPETAADIMASHEIILVRDAIAEARHRLETKGSSRGN